ncbi:MAG: flagellar hook-length control protein FliK [Lachnospiraceae bacterium]|nr:flagellar hook-length control protein FliK [Lachnospiraceae bacterium]
MANVNDVTSLSPANVLPITGGKMQKGGEANGFSEIMKQAAQAGEDAQNDLMNLATSGSDNKNESDLPVKSADSENRTEEKTASKNETVKNDGKTRAAGEKKEASGVKETNSKETKSVEETPVEDADIAEAEEEIITAVAQLLGIAPEELSDILSQLDLTAADLTVAGNAADVLAQARDISPADIVMSEELTGIVKEMSAAADTQLTEAAQQLGISVEELSAKIAEAVESVPVIADETETATVQEPAMTVVNTAEVLPKEEKPLEAAETKDEDKAAVKADEDSLQVQTFTEDKTEKTDRRRDNSDRHDNGSGQQNAQSQSVSAQPVHTESTQAPLYRQEGMQEALSAARTQDVINQISEYVKVNRSEKMTGIEMMLNPANLGSIRLQLETNNGVLKGQLTASDEAVRAALESQLSVLKEALAEQGMKVEALEVTVAGHQLEQNLDQGGKGAEQQAEDMAARKSSRRILDLNTLDAEEAEEMTDAQKLEVEMMRMGGNRLNFQA